ncbi:hypothetical protein BAC3_01790, partial [uncultured bacterium]
KIDALLIQAGWSIFDHKQAHIYASLGVAIREFPLVKGHGQADYLLYVNGQAVGIIEAKRAGTTLRGVEVQSKRYSEGLPSNLPAPHRPLPFLYESTGVETHFSNGLDPTPCARSVFAFHRPETLETWLKEFPTQQTFLTRMQNLPALKQENLWTAQIKAVLGLETSLKNNQPRALVQMATGSGKTFTAINLCYRLIKFAKAKRILFLVDRGNLGTQTLKEFQQFQSPHNNYKFTEEFIVQQLNSNFIDESARVCICTIQRMYSMLKGVELTEEEDQASSEELADLFKKPPPLEFNANIPIETFDIIIIDECHRSIYNLWAQVLEYFDAYLIGLTATPNKQTFGFFNQNLVMEYNHQQAVADGVNVPFDVYTIETKISKQGETIEAGYSVQLQDPQTRAKRWEILDEDLTYSNNQLDKEVVAVDQIRKILETFRDKTLLETFPERTWLPKTLIFAKDDNHAENIVQIAREVFKLGNEAVQKITYKTTGKKPEDLIKAFRNNPMPRIAVTVDMIATGTDIKAVEIVFFMRAVQSRSFFEQMKGRGVRVIKTEDLQNVTPDAPYKDHFLIVDAVGVCAATKNDNYTFEQKRNVAIEKLLQNVGLGSTETKTLITLAGRLARLEHRITDKQNQTLEQITNGLDLKTLSRQLIDAVNPDLQLQYSQQQTGEPNPDEQTIAYHAETLKRQATKLFSDPKLREFIIELSNQSKPLIIDGVSVDSIIYAGASQNPTDKAQALIKTFEDYLQTHKDEITALQIIFNRPYAQRLDLKAIQELAEQIEKPPFLLNKDNLWQAYSTLGKGKQNSVTL